MLACIPAKGKAGVEEQVSEHFGSTPYFILYNTDSDDINILDNSNAHHSHGTCHPISQLAGKNIDTIVCGGMGRRAIEALSVEGIRVCRSDKKTVGEIIEEIKAGSLSEIDPATACRGHGQTGGCGHTTLTDIDTKATQGRGSGFGQGGSRNRGGSGQGR